MFRNFADLKRAAQGDIFFTIGKGNPETDKENRSGTGKISRAQLRKDRGESFRTSSPKNEFIDHISGSGLNIHAKEFASFSTSESSDISFSPSDCNGIHSKSEESALSLLRSSLQKLSLNESSRSALECDNFSERPTLTRKNISENNIYNAQNDDYSLQKFNLLHQSYEKNDRFSFFGEHESLVDAVFRGPGSLKAKDFIFISDMIIKKSLENIAWSESLASLSCKILEVDQRNFFAQIHLNNLKYAVDGVLGSGIADPKSFSPFISFLHAFFSEVKENKKKLVNILPSTECPFHLCLIELLGCACFHLLCQKNLNLINDMELLMFVFSSINEDLQTYFPELRMELLNSIRDAFLSKRGSAQVRILLLQLLELAASKWRLPARTIHFYQKHFLKE